MKSRLFVLMAAIALCLALPAGAGAQGEPEALRVYDAGPADAVHQALGLIPGVEFAGDAAVADLIVLHNAALTEAQAQAVVDSGKPVILFLGPDLPLTVTNLLLGQPGIPTPEVVTEPATLVGAPGVDDPLLSDVNWNSAPQVRERSALTGAGLGPLIVTEDGRMVIGRHDQVTAVTAWLTGDYNTDLQEWPYFNYLVYHLAASAAGRTPMPYADYPAAPVPHSGEKAGVVVLLAVLLAGTTASFVLVRRYSLRHPEILDHLVADASRFRRSEEAGWEDVGFHRPLAGFLFLLAIGLVLFIVLMIYQQVVLYGILLPSAQARGVWSLIVSFFNTFWVLFDWGTSTAFVKYFAQYRVGDPARGIKYGQFFVWWQAITGTVQLGLVALVAAFLLPGTASAFMSYYLVVHALIQFPGFLAVFQYAFRGMQRQDYDQVLNLVLYLAPVALQSGTVLLLSRWGAANPAFGRSMGGVLGLGIGAYAAQLLAFVVGYWLLRRIGMRSIVLFLAHFDRDTVVSALKFGAPVTIAGVAGGIGYTIQAALVAGSVRNWTEVQGNWDVVSPNGLLLAYSAVAGLYYSMMPAISEAFSHGRLQLTRYYVAQGFKYGGFISLFVASALLGVGDRFILGALGPGYQRAAELMLIMGLWGAIQFPAWFADRVQEGAGRPDLEMWLLIGEQALRIALMFLLVPRFQLMGLIIAYCVALPVKDVAAWLVNRAVLFHYRIYWWQSAAAPLLAGGVNYLLLRLLGNAIWGGAGDQVSSVLLFFIALLPSLAVFCFLDGLFGGWDDDSLAELRRAAGMSSLGKPVAWAIYHTSRWGGRLSPLHGRFPIDLYAAAQAEGESLTKEKVTLV
jgi:O-antigen/teichoic acid export membrane protein